MQKAVLRNFANFTRKYLCWGLFLIKLQANTGEAPTQAFPVKFAKYLRTPVLKNICKRLLLPITYSSKFLKDFIIFLPNVLYLPGRRVEAKSLS